MDGMADCAAAGAFDIHAVRRRRSLGTSWAARGNLPGIGGGSRSQFNHDLNLHIAALQPPFIVLLKRYRPMSRVIHSGHREDTAAVSTVIAHICVSNGGPVSSLRTEA
jgi:hypothetical protein